MSSNKTPFLALNQWAADDSVLRADFNSDNSKLDAFLALLPRTAYGSYVGTGTSGPGNPNTVTVDFTPQLVVITHDTHNSLEHGTLMIRGQAKSSGFGQVNNSLQSLSLFLSWGEHSVSWYSGTANNGNDDTQLNKDGETYHWFAIGV